MTDQPKPEPLSAEELTVLCGDDPNTGAISRLWNNRKRVLATITAQAEKIERLREACPMCEHREAELVNLRARVQELEVALKAFLSGGTSNYGRCRRIARAALRGEGE